MYICKQQMFWVCYIHSPRPYCCLIIWIRAVSAQWRVKFRRRHGTFVYDCYSSHRKSAYAVVKQFENLVPFHMVNMVNLFVYLQYTALNCWMFLKIFVTVNSYASFFFYFWARSILFSNLPDREKRKRVGSLSKSHACLMIHIIRLQQITQHVWWISK